jgi:general secretion pathway protein G
MWHCPTDCTGLPRIALHRAAGYTLIELIVTLAVLGVLALQVVPLAQLQSQRAKERELRLALREVRQAIDAYKRAYDEGRITRNAEASGYPPTLELLVDGVEDARDPNRHRIYFLRRIPQDPFHPTDRSSRDPVWGLRSYRSEPDKPQAGADVYDIYSLSGATAINGVPYKEW